MSHSKVYPVPKHVQKTAYLNNDDYLRMYARSMENPDAFWGEMAEELLVWHKKWDTVKNCNFTELLVELSNNMINCFIAKQNYSE